MAIYLAPERPGAPPAAGSPRKGTAVRITVNKLSALRVLRSMRALGQPGRQGAGRRGQGAGPLAGLPRHDLAAPDPSPRKRWTAGMLPLGELALDERPSSRSKLDVAVPSPEARFQGTFASSTVYSEGLPPGSFVQVSDSVSIPCPELLFVEAARVMQPAALVLLGYELCGTYARDPRDPRSGPVAFGVEPATSVGRIRDFIGACSGVRGMSAAARALRHVRDGAWSPMEALVAALAVMPPEELGYGVGDVRLNARRDNGRQLVEPERKGSRVPDIEFGGTPVGLNYDGHGHLDPGSVAEAAQQDGGDASAQIESVRSRYVDDLRRNRELAATGLVVLPVTAEDLYEKGALDALMLEVADVMEATGGKDVSSVRLACTARQLADTRQKLLWSLLPWAPGARYGREMADFEKGAGTAEEVASARVEPGPGGEALRIEQEPPGAAAL